MYFSTKSYLKNTDNHTVKHVIREVTRGDAICQDGFTIMQGQIICNSNAISRRDWSFMYLKVLIFKYFLF